MKLFLTGGTGFFGKALLRHWHVQQLAGLPVPEVCVLSRSSGRFLAAHPEYSKLPWLRFVAGDVLAPQSLPQGERFSHILHAAADSTLGPQLTPLAQYDQIVQGTRNLLQFAVQTAAKRFLFVSSGAVYGRQPDHLSLIPEDWHGMPDPQAPSSAYGVAKRAAEHLCALYQNAHRIETVVARCFAFVGQDLPLDVHFAIGNFIRDALCRNVITVRGDGTPLRSYLDQRDLAHWLCCLLEKGQAGQAYNVGSDESISMAELAHLVRVTLAPGKAVKILNTAAQNRLRNRYIPDISKIFAPPTEEILVHPVKPTASSPYPSPKGVESLGILGVQIDSEGLFLQPPINLEIDGMPWIINLQIGNRNGDNEFVSIEELEPEEDEETPRQMFITLGLRHPFVARFWRDDSEIQRFILFFASALGLAEIAARKAGAVYPSYVRSNLDEFLKRLVWNNEDPE